MAQNIINNKVVKIQKLVTIGKIDNARHGCSLIPKVVGFQEFDLLVEFLLYIIIQLIFLA